MKIRTAIQHDISIPEGAILDEVFLGADWKRIPAFKKYQKATPPNPTWNLQGDDLKRYYRSEFLRLAAADKIPVLGISSPYRRSLTLISIPTPDRKEFVRSHLNSRYASFTEGPGTGQQPVIITGQGKCYTCVREFKKFNRRTCVST